MNLLGNDDLQNVGRPRHGLTGQRLGDFLSGRELGELTGQAQELKLVEKPCHYGKPGHALLNL
jgi:hypothetical protein